MDLLEKSLICYVRCAGKTDKLMVGTINCDDRDHSRRVLECFWRPDGMEQLEKSHWKLAILSRSAKITLSKPVERGVRIKVIQRIAPFTCFLPWGGKGGSSSPRWYWLALLSCDYCYFWSILKPVWISGRAKCSELIMFCTMSVFQKKSQGT